MAKESTPIRIQAALMRAAKAEASIQHRSASEQIEFWADIGRQVSGCISPDDMLDVLAGAAELKLETTETPYLDPEEILGTFDSAEARRNAAAIITGATVRYQAAPEHPGLLEQIDAEGQVTLGMFEDGEFVAAAVAETQQRTEMS